MPKTIPNEYILDFIRRYFEGDGSIVFNSSNNNMMFQLSGYKGIVNDIADYLSKGINKSIGVYKDNSIYTIRVTGNNKVKLIMNYLYDDINDINNYPKLIKYNKLIGRWT